MSHEGAEENSDLGVFSHSSTFSINSHTAKSFFGEPKNKLSVSTTSPIKLQGRSVHRSGLPILWTLVARFAEFAVRGHPSLDMRQKIISPLPQDRQNANPPSGQVACCHSPDRNTPATLASNAHFHTHEG